MTQTILRCTRWAALCAALILIATPRPVSAKTYSAQELELLKRVKAEQRELLMRGAHNKLVRAGRAHRARTYKLHYGHSMRPAREVDRIVGAERVPNAFPRRTTPASVLFVPNVEVSDPSQDVPPGDAAQAEPSIAAWGQYVLAAWNDGNGLQAGATQRQGYGYSTDGGATFTDGGEIPLFSPSSLWLSDPVVAVNEKTGEFYYCGLIQPSAGTNGIGIVRGTFSGTSFAWDAPLIVRSGSDLFNFFDKCWIVADSSSGNLYVTYSHFVANSDSIIFQRSTDNGANWSTPRGLSSDAAAGFVQGSRPAVGPNGELYVVWSEIGPVDVDFMRMRVSADQGQSFGPERTIATFFDNFGSGAPGFNRERSIAFPAIAVDRTTGPNRGRVYVAWNESLNWFDELLSTGSGGTVTESGSNNSPAAATAFNIGATLQGTFDAGAIADYFSFNATQGQSYLFWCDNASGNFYTMRVLCTDQTTRLTRAGDSEPPGGNQSFMVWTAPSSGTYYIRMKLLSGDPTSYNVRTGLALPGPERGRDQRDVFVATSTDGALWSSPVRINDDVARYDNWLPEVTVGGDGNVYAIWYDWRDAPADKCGGLSQVYFAVSNNAANSWVSLGAITDMLTPWTDVESNTIPNQGDYIGLFANQNAVYACWADGRILNPNVMAGVVPLAPDTVQVTVATASAAPDRVTLMWQNLAGLSFTAILDRSVAGGGFAATDTLMSDGSGSLTHVDTDVTPGVQYSYRLRITASGTEFVVGAVSVVVPSEKLALTGTRPNPANTSTTISFDVPSPGGQVHLAIFDGTGRLIRTLLASSMSPGPQTSTWDLRDDNGKSVNAGMYFAQLRMGGEKKSRRIVVVP